MSRFQLFAIETQGVRSLPIQPGAIQFSDLYTGLSLGVYDALRTFDHNKFLYLDRHLARTEKSMSLLGWTYALDRPRLLAALDEIVTSSEWPEMRVRIDILAEPAAALGSVSRELIAIQPFTPPPAALYETGVAVDFAADLTRREPLAKTADFAAMRPATSGLKQLEGAGTVSQIEIEASKSTASTTQDPPYEYLLLNRDGYILEGTGTNFWAVRDGVLYTAREGVLEGVTREIILQLVQRLGISLRLQPIRRDEVGSIQEAALSGSSRAFLPVIAIAGARVGNGRPGPVSTRILAAYNEFVRENARPALALIAP
jgi:branched-chain amino acid aminotransferase